MWMGAYGDCKPGYLEIDWLPIPAIKYKQKVFSGGPLGLKKCGTMAQLSPRWFVSPIGRKKSTIVKTFFSKKAAKSYLREAMILIWNKEWALTPLQIIIIIHIFPQEQYHIFLCIRLYFCLKFLDLKLRVILRIYGSKLRREQKQVEGKAGIKAILQRFLSPYTC